MIVWLLPNCAFLCQPLHSQSRFAGHNVAFLSLFLSLSVTIQMKATEHHFLVKEEEKKRNIS